MVSDSDLFGIGEAGRSDLYPFGQFTNGAVRLSAAILLEIIGAVLGHAATVGLARLALNPGFTANCNSAKSGMQFP